jgi:hypothetical protein
VAGCCEWGDGPSDSCATELVSLVETDRRFRGAYCIYRPGDDCSKHL